MRGSWVQIPPRPVDVKLMFSVILRNNSMVECFFHTENVLGSNPSYATMDKNLIVFCKKIINDNPYGILSSCVYYGKYIRTQTLSKDLFVCIEVDKDKYIKIDTTLCVGCNVCTQMCKFGALCGEEN